MTGRGPSSSMETSVQSPKAADTEQTVLCGCQDTDPAEKVQTPSAQRGWRSATRGDEARGNNTSKPLKS